MLRPVISQDSYGSTYDKTHNSRKIKPTFNGSSHYVPDRVSEEWRTIKSYYDSQPSNSWARKTFEVDPYTMPDHNQKSHQYSYEGAAHLHNWSPAQRERETILREIPRKSKKFIFDLNDTTNVVRGVEGATGGSAALAGVGTFVAHVGLLGPIGIATGTVHGIINALGAGSAVGTGTGFAVRALRRSEIEDIHRDFNRTHHRYAEKANAAEQDRNGNATLKSALGGDEGYYEYYKGVAKDVDSRVGELLLKYQNVQPGRAETAYANAGIPLASQKVLLSRLEEGCTRIYNMSGYRFSA
jgi:hypothetical protein